MNKSKKKETNSGIYEKKLKLNYQKRQKNKEKTGKPREKI